MRYAEYLYDAYRAQVLFVLNKREAAQLQLDAQHERAVSDADVEFQRQEVGYLRLLQAFLRAC